LLEGESEGRRIEMGTALWSALSRPRVEKVCRGEEMLRSTYATNAATRSLQEKEERRSKGDQKQRKKEGRGTGAGVIFPKQAQGWENDFTWLKGHFYRKRRTSQIPRRRRGQG